MPRRASRTAQSRTEIITVRMTPDERAQVARDAAAAGLTVSHWAAKALTGGTVILRESASPRTDPALVAELKRVGNNINQIAAALNSGKSATAREVALAMRDLLDALLRDEAMAARVRSFEAARGSLDDSAYSQAGDELQGGVRLHPPRSG